MAAIRPVRMWQPRLNPLAQPQVSSSAAPPVSFPAPAAAPSTSEQLMHKNRLQEYTQRSAISLPIYHTVNEGSQHAPRFRSTVLVDGASYTSPNTFSHRKAAEQDVAKLALGSISQKIKDEGCPLIRQDTVFCKSILNEFAVKMNMEMPTYNTIQPEGLISVFISSLVFNGIIYTGEAGRNKKEAEQLAAREVILSLLGNSGSGTIISEIIKSKGKLYAALHKVKDPSSDHISAIPQGVSIGQISAVPQGVIIRHDSRVISEDRDVAANSASEGANPGSSLGMPPLRHEFKLPKPEPSSRSINIELSSQAISLPIEFVPPVLQQPQGVGPSSGRKRQKNKNKPNKKLRSDTQLPISALPINQPHLIR